MKVVYVDLPDDEVESVAKMVIAANELATKLIDGKGFLGLLFGPLSRAEDLEGDNDDDGTEASGGEGTAPDGGAI